MITQNSHPYQDFRTRPAILLDASLRILIYSGIQENSNNKKYRYTSLLYLCTSLELLYLVAYFGHQISSQYYTFQQRSYSIITNVHRLILFGGNVIFSVAVHDKCLKFQVKIDLTNKHLFYNFFVNITWYIAILVQKQ